MVPGKFRQYTPLVTLEKHLHQKTSIGRALPGKTSAERDVGECE